jgi:predicted CoA-binding protein
VNDREKVDAFLAGSPFAVVGASTNREKYGNKVLRCYIQHDRIVHVVHPKETEIEGLPCYPDLTRLPEPVHGISLITPPKITEKIVEQAPASGARWLWMQPGAESDAAIARAEKLGLGVIASGPCLLVALGFSDV